MEVRAGLEGRGALVTGGASGVGLAVAKLLAQSGVSKLIVADISEEGLEQNVPDLGVETIRLAGDVSSEAFWQERVTPHLDGVELFALNAGIAKTKPIDRFDYADWRRIVAVNLDGTWLGIRAAMRELKAKERPGAIVVTGSSAGIKTDKNMSAYGVSKAAVHHLVRIAAHEGTAGRIRVNAVSPGGISTPIWRAMPAFQKMVEDLGSEQAAFDELGRTGTPLGKYTTPEEVASHIVFLMSDHCSTVTGEIFLNDGGFTL